MEIGDQLPSLPSFLPPMCPVHVMIQVLHLLERVIHLWTPLYLAKVGPLVVGVLLTNTSMFMHALPHPVLFVAMRAEESFIWLWSIWTMRHPLVLFKDGLAGIRLVAHITFMPLALLTGLLMLPQHLSGR